MRARGGRLGPGHYGQAGCNVMAILRDRLASGQAAAKARRTRETVSMTRAPSLRNLEGSRCHAPK